MKRSRTHPVRRASRRAFTLTELLVVLAVIVVLASLLWPAVTFAITKSKTARCQQNLRTLGAAFHQFAADHNGHLPGEQWHLPHPHRDNTVGMQIPHYVDAAHRFLTPWVMRSPFVSGDVANSSLYNGGTYGYNENFWPQNLGGIRPNPKRATGLRLVSIRRPSEALMVADAIGFNIWGRSDSFHRFLGDNRTSRHGGAVSDDRSDATGRNFNALFADGHVKLIRAQDYNPSPGTSNPFPIHWVRIDRQ